MCSIHCCIAHGGVTSEINTHHSVALQSNLFRIRFRHKGLADINSCTCNCLQCQQISHSELVDYTCTLSAVSL